jgi:RNA polymerase sigma factor (sigma-70 family)
MRKYDTNHKSKAAFKTLANYYIRGEITHYLRKVLKYKEDVFPVMDDGEDYEIPDTTYSKAELYEYHDQAKDLLNCLSTRNKKIIEYIYLKGLSQVETAKRLKLSEMAVYRAIVSSISLLQKYQQQQHQQQQLEG